MHPTRGPRLAILSPGIGVVAAVGRGWREEREMETTQGLREPEREGYVSEGLRKASARGCARPSDVHTSGGDEGSERDAGVPTPPEDERAE
jgi:hypothetical protein